MSDRPERSRVRHLPVSVGLGLFVGDLATLGLRGQLTLGRVAVSAVIALVLYASTRWFVGQRTEDG